MAFLIPTYHILLKSEPLPPNQTGALIVAPTRELSNQIAEVAKHFTAHAEHLKLALITGGIRSHEADTAMLRKGCSIVIGTPGRILNCLLSGQILVRHLEVLVFDEADRLLELGFERQINEILSALPKQRRTGLFSATQSSNVRQLVRVGLRNPVRISLKVTRKNQTTQSTPKSLRNRYIRIEEGKEMLYLLYLLHSIARTQKMMVFVLTCAQVDYLRLVVLNLLPDLKKTAWFLHGRLSQHVRTKHHREFSAAKQGVLVCTDVAARGIDIPDVDVVLQVIF